MNEKLLRELAVKSMVVMLGTAATSYGIGTASVSNASFGENIQVNDTRIVPVGIADTAGLAQVYKNLETGVVVNQLAESYLTIQKPSEGTYTLSFEDLYMERKLKISISGLEEKLFSQGDFLTNSQSAASVNSVNLTYDYLPENFTYTAVYEVELNRIYGYQVYEDENAYYIELWKPSELYERILVVDAGHGGNDIGTYSTDMKYYEKDINLNIVSYLKELLDEAEIKVYYTRLADEKVYLNPRIDLANEVEADLLLSIHCNSSNVYSAKGCEVLYGTKNQKELTFNSQDFAQICLKAMTEEGTISARGLVKNNEIYIIGKSKVPIALVEVGFMTNEEDLQYMIKKKNQKQMAEYIYNAIGMAFSQSEEK